MQKEGNLQKFDHFSFIPFDPPVCKLITYIFLIIRNVAFQWITRWSVLHVLHVYTTIAAKRECSRFQHNNKFDWSIQYHHSCLASALLLQLKSYSDTRCTLIHCDRKNDKNKDYHFCSRIFGRLYKVFLPYRS